jgi:hypothetical protein
MSCETPMQASNLCQYVLMLTEIILNFLLSMNTLAALDYQAHSSSNLSRCLAQQQQQCQQQMAVLHLSPQLLLELQ